MDSYTKLQTFNHASSSPLLGRRSSGPSYDLSSPASSLVADSTCSNCISFSLFLHNDILIRNYLNLIYSNETLDTPLASLLLQDAKKSMLSSFFSSSFPPRTFFKFNKKHTSAVQLLSTLPQKGFDSLAP